MSESLSSAHWLGANAALLIFLAVVHFSVMAMFIVVAWNALQYRGETTEEPVQPRQPLIPTARPVMTHPVFAAAEPTEEERARRNEPPSTELK